MVTRTRSILIDTTIGKIFNNVTGVNSADASKLIAGTKALTAKQTQTGTAKVALNVGNGIQFAGPALVSGIQATTSISPKTQNIIITVKTGSSYAAASNVANVGTVTITTGTKSNTISSAIQITAGNYLYWDIAQVGIGQPGSKVTIVYTYYSGY